MASLDVNQVIRDEEGKVIERPGGGFLTYGVAMRRALLGSSGRQDAAERFDLAEKLKGANGIALEFKSDEVVLLRKVLFEENPLQYTVLVNGPLQAALKEM